MIHPSYAQAQVNIFELGRSSPLHDLGAVERYTLLRALYANNGLYESVARLAYEQGTWLPALKALRNPTRRVVEFHAAKLLAEPLAIEADNARIITPIEQTFWRASNFRSRRSRIARQLAMLGDSFLKVVSDPVSKRVYLELVDASLVTDFDCDERGFVTWIRVDVPGVVRNERGQQQDVVHVEVWSKAEQSYRRWLVRNQALSIVNTDDDLSDLGKPADERPLSDFGIDYVPWVHVPFMDIGEQYGQAAVWGAIDKINEANLICTRLHRVAFRGSRSDMAIVGDGRDPKTGQSNPPPNLTGAESTKDSIGTIYRMGEDVVMGFPSGWKPEWLIPNLPYQDLLEILNAHMTELEDDLPEMAYSRARDLANDSGIAIRYKLMAAVDRGLEARGNLEAGLVRAQQMFLTQASFLELIPDVGTYEAGDFEHSFRERGIILLSDREQADTELLRAQAFTTATGQHLPMADGLGRVYNLGDDEQAAVIEAAADQVAQGAAGAIPPPGVQQ